MGCAAAHPVGHLQSDKVPVIRQTLFDEHQALLKEKGLRILNPETTGPDFSGWGEKKLMPDDCLLIIDMQNDFIPHDVAPEGGRFGVPEGGSCVAPIIKLIEEFSTQGALVVATRDYHPHDHCSFTGHGGPFPAHCVQGSTGSFFYPPLGRALIKAAAVEHRKKVVASKTHTTGRVDNRKSHAFRKPDKDEHEDEHKFARPCEKAQVEIVFKGFVEEVDSFGGFEYAEECFTERVEHCTWNTSSPYECVTCAGPWTGCWSFKCSAHAESIDAAPDVMAVLRPDKKALHDIIPKKGRLLIVGLAFDFCVLDSAINARKLGYEQVFIGIEAVRAAHIPGIGEHGSGFLTPPDFLVGKFSEHKIRIVSCKDMLSPQRQKELAGMRFAETEKPTE